MSKGGEKGEEERERSRNECYGCSPELPVGLTESRGIRILHPLSVAQAYSCLSDQNILWWNPVISAETEYKGVTVVFTATIARQKTKSQSLAVSLYPYRSLLPTPSQS